MPDDDEIAKLRAAFTALTAMHDLPLFLTDAATAARVGLSERKWRDVAAILEREGLPKRDPLFANKRYWPAVRAFLDRRAGLRKDGGPLIPDGEENWDAN